LNNIISSASGRDGIFAKSSRRDTSRQSAQLEIRKTTNVDPLFRIERPQLGSAMCPECPRKDWKGMACWLHPRESVPEVVQVPGGVEW